MTSDSAQAPPPLPVLAEAAFGEGGSTRQTSPLRVVAVLSVGFALFVSASIGLGLVLWRDPSSTSAQRVVGGSAGLPSPGGVGTAPIGYLDERTRTATIGPASLTMPGDPYVLSPDPMEIRGVLDLLFWASAPVHIRYDGKHDWSSGVLLGRVAEPSNPGDLRTEGTADPPPLEPGHLRAALDRAEGSDLAATHGERAAGDAVLCTGALRGRPPAQPLRHRHGLLVRLDDGSLIMAASSVPNDADSDMARQAADALRT